MVMFYSRKWYNDEIGTINGVKTLIIEESPGKVELLLIVFDEADVESIKKVVIEKMQAKKGLFFEANLTILKAESFLALSDLYGEGNRD